MEDTQDLRAAMPIEQLYGWLVNHLREAHDVTASVTRNGKAKDSFADLKAAHDLLHALGADEQPG